MLHSFRSGLIQGLLGVAGRQKALKYLNFLVMQWIFLFTNVDHHVLEKLYKIWWQVLDSFVRGWGARRINLLRNHKLCSPGLYQEATPWFHSHLNVSYYGSHTVGVVK
jgi:hypothetical protein